MRWIQKSNEPRPLVEWRNRYRNDVNFGYSLMRGDHEVVNAINHSLLMEQEVFALTRGDALGKVVFILSI